VGDIVQGEECDVVYPQCWGTDKVLSSVASGPLRYHYRHIDIDAHDVWVKCTKRRTGLMIENKGVFRRGEDEGRELQ
jgi:hypothetical protein